MQKQRKEDRSEIEKAAAKRAAEAAAQINKAHKVMKAAAGGGGR
jgi:hypothetical protein